MELQLLRKGETFGEAGLEWMEDENIRNVVLVIVSIKCTVDIQLGVLNRQTDRSRKSEMSTSTEKSSERVTSKVLGLHECMKSTVMLR